MFENLSGGHASLYPAADAHASRPFRTESVIYSSLRRYDYKGVASEKPRGAELIMKKIQIFRLNFC